MDETEAHALSIRMRSLEMRLREIKAAATNKQQDRFSAHQALVAVVDFVDSIPDGKRDSLGDPLVKLIRAISNIENGRQEEWLKPPKRPGAPVRSNEVALLRGRYAAVMDFLIEKGAMGEIAAAEFVARATGQKS
jgi:hypothetical protein